MVSDAVDQWLEQPTDLAQPVGQRRAAGVHAFTGINLRLAVKRQVVHELGHDDVRQQPRSGTATQDRQRRCRRLGDRVAALVGELGADVAHDLEAGGHIL